MPAPYALAKYVATPLKKKMITNGKWDVVTHVGRVSGREHKTPVAAIPVDGGLIIFVMYGSHKTDWVKNVLHAGKAGLWLTSDETVDVVDPVILSKEAAWELLPPGTEAPPNWAKVDEYLFLQAV